MIDLKKIAEKIREIASFYAPNDGCTNAIYDAQIAIANELDPPEPKPEPEFKVGDWVDCGRIAGHGRIDQINEAGKIHVEMTDGEHAEWFMPDGSNTYQSNAAPYSELRIIRKLDPSEVRVKVTLEGTVMPGANESMFELSNRAGGWNTLGFNAIDPETAALVKALLKAQEEK